MSSLTSKAESTVRYILADHVILDYYDELKLGDLHRNKSGTIVTTLLQTTGVAQNRQGFLNITVSSSGREVVFGSAVKGAQHDSRMVKMVAAQPHNISVIQISQPIIAPGLDGFSDLPPSTSPITFDDEPVAPPPKKDKKKKKPSDDEEDSDDADADAPSDDTDDDASADADAESPSDEGKDSKVADGGHGGNEKLHKKNGGAKVVVGGGAMVSIFMGLLGLLL